MSDLIGPLFYIQISFQVLVPINLKSYNYLLFLIDFDLIDLRFLRWEFYNLLLIFLFHLLNQYLC